MAYQERFYRLAPRGPGLVSFTARVKETDLWILAARDLTKRAEESIMDHRRGLETYIRENPGFVSSLVPLPADPLAPPLVRAMLQAGRTAGTGPMAAVAGAIAQAVALDLLADSPEAVVENGGDLYLCTQRDLTVGLWAGKSPYSGRLGIKIPGGRAALATSSGTVGHSLSLGRADAATILADDGALADAAATALGNRVKGAGDLGAAVQWASTLPGVRGALAILGYKLGAWGDLDLVEL